MTKNPSNILQNTVQEIFLNNDKIIEMQGRSKQSHSTVSKQELEFALAVLLVDLAGCDQTFDIQEYSTIQNGLRRVFGTTKTEVTALINRAQQTLKDLRGTGRFGTMLRESLDQKQREVIMQVIEDVIQADGLEDGFEIYLRQKFSDLLGVANTKPLVAEQSS